MHHFYSIKNRIFLNFTLVALSVVLITYLSYELQRKSYNDLIDYSVESKIDEIRDNILKTDRATLNLAHSRQAIFKKIHLAAHEELLQNPSLDLHALREKLKKNLPLGAIDLHIYLLEKNIIYNTTYPQDLHLDMSLFPGAMIEMMKAYEMPNSVIFALPSIDILKKDYRVYSYSALGADSKKILEMGFFDADITQLKKDLLSFNVKPSLINEIALYTNYGENIFNVLADNTHESASKQKYLLENKHNTNSDIEIVKQVLKSKKAISFETVENGKTFKIFYSLINHVYHEKTGHYILKVKMDISTFENTLHQLRVIFYSLLCISILLIFLFYFFLKKAYVQPLDAVLFHMVTWQKVTNKALLSSNDEFSKLAHSFNMAYDRQEAMNRTLEERVAHEVQKNKEKEKQFLAQSKLAQMGELLSMIAHQWRQPLGAIQSGLINLEMMLIESKKFETKNSFNRKLKILGDYVQFLSCTIDDFRNFFKTEKEQELLSGLIPIQRALQITLTAMGNKNIKIEKVFHADESILIYPNEIMQVILNILKNSEDNFVEKKTYNPTISITTTFEKGYFVIRICDNGAGIAPEIMPLIFDPYFSTKDEKNGTGLGLYISKIIIEEHHRGQLNAYNTNDGVCFELMFNTLNPND